MRDINVQPSETILRFLVTDKPPFGLVAYSLAIDKDMG